MTTTTYNGTRNLLNVLAASHVAEAMSWAWSKLILESGIEDVDYRQEWGFELQQPCTVHVASLAIDEQWASKRVLRFAPGEPGGCVSAIIPATTAAPAF